jgi:hypothetical protein
MKQREFPQIAGVILILLALRIPALTGIPNLHTDATEYIDIARNIAAGEGPVLKIRSYFFNDGFTLPYPAAPLRSILFPLLMSGIYAVTHSSMVFQWFNFGMFLANILLLTLILRPVLPSWALAYSLLLIGLCEPVFLTSIFPGSEQTAFFWLLLSLLMASREIHKRWGWAGALAEGFTAALAAMSRPEYVLVGVLFLLWLWFREKRPATCALFLAGFVIPLAGLSAWHFHQYGRIFITSDYLFRSRHYKSYFSLTNAEDGGAGRFVFSNGLWILWRILRNAANYAGKLLGWKNLFFLAAALPLVFRSTFNDPDWRRRHLAIVPAVFFVGYSLVWSTLDRERFLLAMTPFWLPLCIVEVNRWRTTSARKWIRIAALLILIINLPLSLANVLRADWKIQHRTGFGERFYAREDPSWSNPDVAALAAWIRKNTAKDDIFCLENPFMANYLTGRLALLMPENLQQADFLPLLHTYKVRYWINNPVFTNRSAVRLSELRTEAQKAGAQLIDRCGTYEIWAMAEPESELNPQSQANR